MSQRLRRRFDEARLAMMLLSRLPVGQLQEPVPALAAAQWAYPLTGLVIGMIGWVVLQLALAVGLAPLPSAGLALLALALVTGGLHHDGLADLADGLGGGRDRAHCLEIMRDSRIGSHGALALIFVVLLAATGLAAVAETLSLAAFLLVSVTSRLTMLGALIVLPPARDSGLGHGAAARSGAAWLAGAIVTGLLAIAAGPVAIAVLAAAALAGGAVALIAQRRLGGQTGDVLGAIQVVCEAVAWLAMSVILVGQGSASANSVQIMLP